MKTVSPCPTCKTTTTIHSQACRAASIMARQAQFEREAAARMAALSPIPLTRPTTTDYSPLQRARQWGTIGLHLGDDEEAAARDSLVSYYQSRNSEMWSEVIAGLKRTGENNAEEIY